MPYEPGLQGVLVGEPEFLPPGLCGGGLPPLVLGTFVTADVDERREPRGVGGEQLQDLLEHPFVEAQGVVRGGEYVGVDAPGVPDGEAGGVDDVGVAEFGIRGDRGLRVARYVDFGDDRDMPLGGVGDDLPDVVLGVEAAVRPLVPQG